MMPFKDVVKQHRHDTGLREFLAVFYLKWVLMKILGQHSSI